MLLRYNFVVQNGAFWQLSVQKKYFPIYFPIIHYVIVMMSHNKLSCRLTFKFLWIQWIHLPDIQIRLFLIPIPIFFFLRFPTAGLHAFKVKKHTFSHNIHCTSPLSHSIWNGLIEDSITWILYQIFNLSRSFLCSDWSAGRVCCDWSISCVRSLLPYLNFGSKKMLFTGSQWRP